jgi:hypothetical protein
MLKGLDSGFRWVVALFAVAVVGAQGWLTLRYHYSPYNVSTGVALASVLWAVGEILARSMATVSSRLVRRLAAVLWGTLSLILLAFYGANWVSLASWGEPLSRQMIFGFLPDFWQLLGEVGHLVPFPRLLFTLLLLAWFAGWWLAGPRLFGEPANPEPSQSGRLRSRVLGFTAVGLIWTMVGIHFWSGGWRGDPLLSFVKTHPDVLQSHANAAVLAERRRIRDEFTVSDKVVSRDVIIIILDAMRRDHMGLYGYERSTTPRLEEAFARGDWQKVERAYSVAAISSAGIPTILFGVHPTRLEMHELSLFEMLKAHGFQTACLLSGNHSDWYSLRESYGPSIDFFFDGSLSKRFSASDDRVLLEGLERLSPAGEAPALIYLHLMSTHTIGVHREKFQQFSPHTIDLSLLLRNPGGINQTAARNRCDNGMLQADTLIFECLEALARKGYDRDPLIIVTADHGEALGEGGAFGHGSALIPQVLEIPLLIRDGSATHSYRNLEFGDQLDIVPTILDRLGIARPPHLQGVSLYSEVAKSYSLPYVHSRDGVYEGVLIEDGEEKWLWRTFRRHHQGSESKKVDLYEIGTDPLLEVDRWNTAPGPLKDRLREAHAIGYASPLAESPASVVP